MNQHAGINAQYGSIIEPATLRIERLLPGPVDRVWSFLVDSERRRQWLAAGPMELRLDGPVELVWRNDELTDPPGERPDGFGAEHSMQSRVTALEPMRRLAFSWGPGEVTFTLEPQGDNVLLTLVHRRISDRANMVMIGAGWHMHLAILVAILTAAKPEPFWTGWSRLRQDYDRLIPPAS